MPRELVLVALCTIDFFDLTNHSRTDCLDGPSHAGVGVTLVAKLSGDVHLLSDVGQLTTFPSRMCQWLFAVDMFAHQHRVTSCVKVGVIWRADDDRINLFVEFVEHDAEVLELVGAVEIPKSLACSFLIDIAHCHDVLTGNTADIFRPLTADSNAGNIELFIR